MSEKENEKKPQQPPLSQMIEDPYGFKTLEISEAQEQSGELELDPELDGELDGPEYEAHEAAVSIPSDSDAQLGKLAEAMANEAERHASDTTEQTLEGESEEQAAQRLAEQIAEDQALAAQVAREEEEALRLDPELKAALPNSAELDLLEVQSCIEALLFMTDKPMSTEKLREFLGPDFTPAVFQEAVTALQDRYKANHHGIELVNVAGGFQFRTKPVRAPLARKLAKVSIQKLSSGAMETLSIVAYKQPVMKDDIDKIRGVDSSYFIRGLLDRKLIQISGRSELPGRPMLYGTGREFLELFGLKDLASMPPLHELEAMIPASQAKMDEDDPRIKEMRRLVDQMKSDTSTTLTYDPKEDEKLLKEIKERVSAIPSSTPYLDEQKALEAQGAPLKKEPHLGIGAETPEQPSL